MDFDGFIYIFAVIGIALTAAAASLGVALVVTMARLSYGRFKLVSPLLFTPIDVVAEKVPQRLPTPGQPAFEPVPHYTETTRQPAPNGGLKKHGNGKSLDIAATQ